MVFQHAPVDLAAAAALQAEHAQRPLPPRLDSATVDIPQITNDGLLSANLRVQMVVNGYRVSW